MIALSWSGAWGVTQVVVGVGFLIFFHELGHFLMARKFGVRVEVFSLGFGPCLVQRTRGDTEYRISAIPLGGYVKMAGEGEDGVDPDDEGALPNKSVGARFWIFSAGVLANLLLALILLPILFRIGVPFISPSVGDTVPGGAAWRAGVPVGSTIVEINGKEVQGFLELRSAMALASSEGVQLLLRKPEGGLEPLFLRFGPEDLSGGIPDPGIRPSLAAGLPLDITPEQPADQAGLATGDRLVSINGAALDVRNARRLWGLATAHGEPIDVVVERDGRVLAPTRVTPEEKAVRGDFEVGVGASVALVTAFPDGGSPAQAAGLLVGDEILTAAGRTTLDPADFRAALTESDGSPTELSVRGEDGTVRMVLLPAGAALRTLDTVALGMAAASTRVSATPGAPAEGAGLRDGDEIRQVNGEVVASWNDLRDRLHAVASLNPTLDLLVHRPGREGVFTVTVAPRPPRQLLYGLGLRLDQTIVRKEGMVAAIAQGWRSSLHMLQDAAISLKKVIGREISADNLGGIITIGVVSYGHSRSGLVKLLFFLAILSVHLALLNALPVPILDGGHLVFLLIEKIKGKPLSQRVMGATQMIGLMLLLSLIAFVTYSDFKKWILPSFPF